jgi:hypothetical protein
MTPFLRTLLYRLLVLSALLGALGSRPACAQVVTTFNFDFNFTFVSNLSPGSNYGTFSGSFSATGSSAASYVISSMSQQTTLGNYTATLLSPGTFASNDNTLIFPANSGYFSLGGVSFVANNVDYNLYYSTSGAPYYAITTGLYEGTGAVYAGTVTEVGAPGPVPGAGLWSFGGLCVGGAATRYRLCVAMGASALRKLFALSQRMGGASQARA